MASTGASGSSGTGGGSRSVFERLFRNEGLVSKADLRVDVAKTIARIVVEDATVDLDEASLHARGNLRLSRASRVREVTGNYVSRVEHSHTNMIGMAVEERVEGGVDYRMQRDHDFILGGAYFNTIAGPFVRLCAWADFLAWGGWLEVDTIRIDIAGLMIHSYMFLAYATLARVTVTPTLVDDFTMRMENFGMFIENYSGVTHLGGPGSGGTMEA